jgi:hypothetical protein
VPPASSSSAINAHPATAPNSEAETGGIFLNAQHAIQIITALLELKHLQPENGTRIATDNSTACGILTANLRQKHSKAFDMRYWWVRDRIKQRQFNLIWEPGKTNRADYFTKHFPPKHHQEQRKIYLHSKSNPQAANVTTQLRPRGCVTTSTVIQRLFRPEFLSRRWPSKSFN